MSSLFISGFDATPDSVGPEAGWFLVTNTGRPIVTDGGDYIVTNVAPSDPLLTNTGLHFVTDAGASLVVN